MTRLRIKVWYRSGETTVSPERPSAADLMAWWQGLAGDDVQIVAVFYAETYPITKQDGYDEHGHPVNQRTVREHYVDLLRGWDYYWYDPVADAFGGANRVHEIPVGAVVVRASAMTDEAWFALYNAAKEDREAV